MTAAKHKGPKMNEIMNLCDCYLYEMLMLVIYKICVSIHGLFSTFKHKNHILYFEISTFPATKMRYWMMYLKFLLMWDVFHEYKFPRIYDFFLENRPLLDTIITLLPSTLICTEFAYVLFCSLWHLCTVLFHRNNGFIHGNICISSYY